MVEQHKQQNLQEFSKLQRKLAKEKNRRIFLVRCKNLGIVPNFIKIKNKKHNFQSHRLNEKYKTILCIYYTKLLSVCIDDSYSQLNIINSKLNNLKKYIDQNFSDQFRSNFYTERNIKFANIFNKIKNKHIKKINILMHKDKNNRTSYKLNNNWLQNLTNVVLPNDAAYFLSLGPRFSLCNFKTPIDSVIASVEKALSFITTNDRVNIRNKVCNILTNHENKLKNLNTKIINKYNFFAKRTKEFLNQNPSLYILTADKCNKTVIMHKNEYKQKISNLLNDNSTYKKEKCDPTSKIQTKINSLISKWYNSKYIDLPTKNGLICHNGISPCLYGLPKLHKDNIPLRPIVSNIGAPSYKLSKFFSKIIQNIIGQNNFYVKDPWQFKEFIAKQKIPTNFILVSFDVSSLFTNIPTDLVIKCIKKQWDKIKPFTTLPLHEFINGVELCLSTTYFKFENDFYSQIFGTAMGSPISSTVANLVMEELENDILNKLVKKPIFYKRYVDDCLLCIHKNELKNTLDSFNSFHQRIQFTFEKEINKTINFLNITIMYNDDGQIETNWYTKKDIWSGRYLNFDSLVPNIYKKSVINNLVDMAIKLSSPKFHKENINKIKQILKENNYPQKFYSSVINKRLQHINNTTPITYNQQNKKFVSMPYIHGVSEQISKIFHKNNVVMAHKPVNITKKYFTKLKSKTEVGKFSNIIYKIDCTQCDASYIGQTKQYLEKRLKQHKNDIKTNNLNSTALSKHALEQLHHFNFDNAKVLAFENDFIKKNVLEMINIKKFPYTINFREDTNNLSNVYNNLIKE